MTAGAFFVCLFTLFSRRRRGWMKRLSAGWKEIPRGECLIIACAQVCRRKEDDGWAVDACRCHLGNTTL